MQKWFPTRRMIGLTAAAILALGSANAGEAACKGHAHAGSKYTVCEFDLRDNNLRLYLNNGDGKPYGSFQTLRRDLKRRGSTLSFAMNAGMYHRDRSPVGLYVENGEQAMHAVTGPGPGNFHMLPNGIFSIDGDTAAVSETRSFVEQGRSPQYATQSGPMLVVDDDIHPRFIPGSDHRKIRNGVGVRDQHTAVLAISNEPVNFYDFATLFRDELGIDNALYLDGTISSLYAPEVGRRDGLFPLGPIIAVVVPDP